MKREAPAAAASASEPWRVQGPEADALLDLARHEGVTAPESERRAEQRFLNAFRQAREPRPSWQRLSGYALALAAAAALALLVVRLELWPRGALSYQLNRGAVTSSPLLEATNGPIDVQFSDGSSVTVERGSQARILDTTRRGAHLRLDGGRVAFNVLPRPERGDWSLDAGPYQVRVTGTAFTVEWSAAQELFQVDVARGHVLVVGAGLRKELRAGETFRHVGAATANAAAQSAGVAAARLAQDTPPASSAEPLAPAAPAARANTTLDSWAQQVALGQFDAVVSAAERRGVPSCLRACSLTDLKALADAARLTSRAALAKQALLAQRQRFAGTGEAKAAAFLLGRLAEAGPASEALGWYDTYLTESPNGRFASDALGRKLVLGGARDQAQATREAREYLARFPAGPYAAHARSILEASGSGR
jgi:hypothetical protein